VFVHYSVIAFYRINLQWPCSPGYYKKAFIRELDQVMEKYRKSQVQLMGVRGRTPKVMQLRVDVPGVLERLKYWNPDFSKVGMLMYEQEKDKLDIFYLDNTGRKNKSTVNITKQELQLLEQKLKRSMGAELSLDSIGKRGVTIKGIKTSAEQLKNYSNDLSSKLLPNTFPIAELDHLIIVPTNNIGALPFSMFYVNDTMMLIDKMSYSIVPSINEFVYAKQYHVQRFFGENAPNHEDGQSINAEVSFFNTSEALIVANPLFNDPRFYDPSLPGTEKEAEIFRQYFPNSVYLKNQKATKQAVLKEIRGKSILYFATHGIASVKEPVFNNALFLAGKNSKDVMWTYDEIIKLGGTTPLNVDLVILSACQTGLGYQRAAGIVSLARAFQVSGADNVLMSLWNISDNKTPELMCLFFKHLQTELPFQPFGAMQKAIKEFKLTTKSPIYWAPFSIYGVPY
jgi:CHAT domain-containing protein